jgi:hypothetical protein
MGIIRHTPPGAENEKLSGRMESDRFEHAFAGRFAPTGRADRGHGMDGNAPARVA